MNRVLIDRAPNLTIADMAVAVEHEERGPAGEELNHARIDAVLEHDRHAGITHGVMTDIGEAEDMTPVKQRRPEIVRSFRTRTR